MTISKNDVVYCDANFLIAYGAKKTKQPEKQKRAHFLFAQLLANKCKICVSTLTFDEAWLGVKKEIGPKSISDYFRFEVNKILGRIGIRLRNYGALEFSYFEIFNDLESFTNALLNHKNFLVIQFQDPVKGVKSALTNVQNFKFKPRDAFHLAVAKDNKVTHFITHDEHFIKKEKEIGVRIIAF